MGPKLRKAFQKAGGQTLSDSDWLRYFFDGSNKMRYQYCKNSKIVSLYIRAIQGHIGNLIALELMDRVAIPFKGKNSCFIVDALTMHKQS